MFLSNIMQYILFKISCIVLAQIHGIIPKSKERGLMDIIISGLGSVGRSTMDKLSKGGHNVVVIDLDGQKVEDAVNAYDVKGVIGNCASSEVLLEAGVGSADLLIASTKDDELNILCCIIASRLGVKKTIARSSKPEYVDVFKDEALGVSMIVNPQYEAAMEISRMLRFPSAIKVSKFSKGKVELVEFRAPGDSPLIGLSLKNLGKNFKSKVLICAAQRAGKPIIPTGDFVIAPEDRLFVTATQKNISQFFKQLGWNKPARNVIIVGGSRTAYYLCEELEKLKINVKLIEKDKDRCMQLANDFKSEIICGDGTDHELLIDEGITYTDAFVALGNMDEQNIIMSMFAASLGVPKVITKIDQLSYYDMLQKSGVHSVVSTKNSTADQIIRFVRILENNESDSVRRIFHIIDDTTEILEFPATPSFKQFGIPLQELNLKKRLLIAGIVRDGTLITPSGQDCIMPGDDVIVVTLEEGLANLSDILGN